MWEILSKYLIVTAWSMFKFVFGPLIGVTFGLHPVETYFCTVTGMTLTAILFSNKLIRGRILGFLEKRKKKKKIFTPRTRTLVRVWKKYGMRGVAFLTPLLLTPPFGTLVAVSFGESRQKIVLYMFISAAFWAAVLTAIINIAGVAIIEEWVGTPPV